MSPAEERDLLIESALSAFRERDATGRVLPSPAWMDLPPAAREDAFEAQAASRRLEAAFREDGMNGTVRVVAGRIRVLEQMR